MVTRLISVLMIATALFGVTLSMSNGATTASTAMMRSARS